MIRLNKMSNIGRVFPGLVLHFAHCNAGTNKAEFGIKFKEPNRFGAVNTGTNRRTSGLRKRMASPIISFNIIPSSWLWL